MYFTLQIYIVFLHYLGQILGSSTGSVSTNISSNCTCGISIASRIVFGQTLGENDHTFLALILKNNKFICGGSVISSKYVLTAAHCFQKNMNLKDYNIKLAVHNRVVELNSNAKTFSIDKIVVHEQYEELTDKIFNNDIALMELNETITFSSYIQPICLPTSDIPELKTVEVQGWGYTEDGYPSAVPKKATLTLLTPQQCQASKIGKNFGDPKTHLCAEDEVVDACQGDSGGPMFVKDARRTNFLIGIVSSGVGCAKNGYPGIYTKVQPFVNWIFLNTENSFYCKV